MKRAILALSVMLVAYGVQAQGFIKFGNNAASLITTNLFGVTGPAGGAGTAGSYIFELMVGLDGQAPSSTTISNANSGTLGAGRISNRNVDVGKPVGDFVSVQVIGWSRNLGLNYQQFLVNKPTATTGFWGESAIGRYQLASATGVATAPVLMVDGTTPPAGFVQIPGFALNAVPEPSAIALGVLGLGALILFRRRKN